MSRDLNRTVPELVSHVSERLAVLNQETGIRVPQIVQTNALHVRVFEEPVENPLTQVIAIEGRAIGREGSDRRCDRRPGDQFGECRQTTSPI
jgi:hypothetical protein